LDAACLNNVFFVISSELSERPNFYVKFNLCGVGVHIDINFPLGEQVNSGLNSLYKVFKLDKRTNNGKPCFQNADDGAAISDCVQ
ncbi:unnamed protein product, partial [Callosobruchus maculatus]